VVSALPAYFTDFWRKLGGHDASSILVREDGGIVARNPPSVQALQPLAADSTLHQAILSGASGVFRNRSRLDGVNRVYAFRKVPDFPVYVAYGVSIDAALAA